MMPTCWSLCERGFRHLRQLILFAEWECDRFFDPPCRDAIHRVLYLSVLYVL